MWFSHKHVCACGPVAPPLGNECSLSTLTYCNYNCLCPKQGGKHGCGIYPFVCLEFNFVEYIYLNAEAFFHYADCSSQKKCKAQSIDKAHRQRMGTDNKRQTHSNQSYKRWQIEKKLILTDSEDSFKCIAYFIMQKELLVLFYPPIPLFPPNSYARHPLASIIFLILSSTLYKPWSPQLLQ